LAKVSPPTKKGQQNTDKAVSELAKETNPHQRIKVAYVLTDLYQKKQNKPRQQLFFTRKINKPKSCLSKSRKSLISP
jgi:hypothetical protein